MSASYPLRSGSKDKALGKPKPHTDLLHPLVYQPQSSLPGHEDCTFDLYPHDGFLGLKFIDSDKRMKLFVARNGRDGPVAIFTESTAAYIAKRRCEEYVVWPNTKELDQYLSNIICADKRPPCKLATAANRSATLSTRPSNPRNGINLRHPTAGFPNATAGPGTNLNVGLNFEPASDADEWRHPWWWFFKQGEDHAFLTRDKYTADRALQLGNRAAFRLDFKEAVKALRGLLDLNPDDLLLYVLQDQQVEVDCDLARNGYLASEMRGSVLCCCSNIDAAGAYIQELIVSGLA
ncbi:hypothetical protein C8R47DRAFT_1074146 [Mycena vitilis]|nr:hypothetical protein C8R47DRAFT_1221038 [Mycena vitilis]KAJ6480755.1 hypothetical protein C8R47DRAFT_1074146 [Mycena vitilis]